MRRRIALLTAVLLLAGLLQGCWNYKELDKMLFVAGCAIDRGTTKKYKVTVDLLSTFKAGKETPVKSIFIDSEGDTIFEAVRNFTSTTVNKLYWPHCQIAIISSDVAADSIQPVMDWFLRDTEPRLTLELLVSEGEAAKVLTQEPESTSISSFEIDSVLENNQKFMGTTELTLLYELYNTLASNGKSATLPACQLVEGNGIQTAQIGGLAVFRRDRLIGFLSAEDAKDYLFVTDKMQGGVVNVQASTGNDIASLEVMGNKTKLTPRFSGGAVEMNVDTRTTVVLDELDTTQDYVDRQGKGPNELKALAEAALARRIQQTVQKVQDQFGTDIFGFGETLHRSDPSAWNQVQQGWDGIFKTMKVSVSSVIDIQNNGSMNSPVEVGSR